MLSQSQLDDILTRVFGSEAEALHGDSAGREVEPPYDDEYTLYDDDLPLTIGTFAQCQEVACNIATRQLTWISTSDDFYKAGVFTIRRLQHDLLTAS